MVHLAHRHIAPARLPRSSERLNVIIPAAGIGKRMKSRGPKGLLRLGHGITILERQIRMILKVHPESEIVVVAGFEYEKVRDELWGQFPVRFICNYEYETTNVIHSVGLGLDACLPGRLLIIHGDLVFNQQTITGLAGEASSLLIVDNQLSPEEVGICAPEGIVMTLSYALDSKWGQMAFLRDDELKIFQEAIRTHRMASQWFLYEAINYVISKGGIFHAHNPHGAKIVEVDKYSDLTKAKQI